MVVQSPPAPPTRPPTSPPARPPDVPTTTRTTFREPIPPAAPDDKAPVWAFVWTLFGFKIATVIIILAMDPGLATGILLLLTTWFWLFIPAVAVAGPVMFRWRLRRLRRRRKALRRSEWLMEDDRPAPVSSRR